MQALGIAYDANKAVPIAQINPKTTAEEEEEPEMMTIEDAKRLAASSQQSEEKWIDGECIMLSERASIFIIFFLQASCAEKINN